MKKIFWVLFLGAFFSCEYKDLSLKTCYLASEENYSGYIHYSYNAQNELISYSTSGIYSSVLTYEGGKIVTEVDNEIVSVNYIYDSQNRISIWSENIQGRPEYSLQTKFFYNTFNQDTLQQYYKYDITSGDLYFWRYARRDFASSHNKNYSRIRVYDAATNTLIYTEDFLWDNHPNPYLTNAFFQNEPPPTNNMTHYAFTQTGSAPEVADFTYDYNSNGFPVYKKLPSNNAFVAHYTYTNCQ